MAASATGVTTHADMFLKLDGIDGESQDSKHKNEIQLQGFSFGAVQPGSASLSGGAGVGKVQIHDLSISKFVDKASVKLFQYCCNGKHVATATITSRKAGGTQQEYLKVYLKEVLITNVQFTGSESHALPMESISLTFSSIKMEYHPQDEKGQAGGAIIGGWDNVKNEQI